MQALRYVKKTGDQSWIASAALANVTGMSFRVEAGLYYAFHWKVVYQSDTLTTGIQIALTHPGATIFAATGKTIVAVDGVAAEYVGAMTASDDPVTSTDVVAVNTDYIFEVIGCIVPSAAGALQLRAAGEVAAGTVKVRRGSVGELHMLS